MNKKNQSLLVILFLTILLVFISLACTVSTNNGNEQNLAATQEALHQTQVALSVEQTLAAAGQGNVVPSAEAMSNVTVAPGEEETVAVDPCEGKTIVNYEGVSFCYAPFIANSTNNTIEPADTSEMSLSPQHIQFEFVGYAISPTFHTPVIHIYPIADYESIDLYVAAKVTELQNLLASKPEHADSIPFLPHWNAGQMLVSKVGYVDFNNGEGIRFLTQYGQSYWPINNENMFYTFQGITDDGQYYISAIFPTSNPSLPANGEAYPGDINDLATSYDSYIENIRILLYSQDDNSFNPSITALDELISTISINQ